MVLVMMNVAEGYKIVDGVPAFVHVMLPMVEFKHFPGIVRGKHPSIPATSTFDTLEPITLQNRYSNGVRN